MTSTCRDQALDHMGKKVVSFYHSIEPAIVHIVSDQQVTKNIWWSQKLVTTRRLQ